jgi:hypothetical protein
MEIINDGKYLHICSFNLIYLKTWNTRVIISNLKEQTMTKINTSSLALTGWLAVVGGILVALSPLFFGETSGVYLSIPLGILCIGSGILALLYDSKRRP